jgi:hypothetical protein
VHKRVNTYSHKDAHIPTRLNIPRTAEPKIVNPSSIAVGEVLGLDNLNEGSVGVQWCQFRLCASNCFWEGGDIVENFALASYYALGGENEAILLVY